VWVRLEGGFAGWVGGLGLKGLPVLFVPSAPTRMPPFAEVPSAKTVVTPVSCSSNC
jgi:hypothetical protein